MGKRIPSSQRMKHHKFDKNMSTASVNVHLRTLNCVILQPLSQNTVYFGLFYKITFSVSSCFSNRCHGLPNPLDAKTIVLKQNYFSQSQKSNKT